MIVDRRVHRPRKACGTYNAVGQQVIDDPELDELKREFLAEAGDKVREIEECLAAVLTAQTLERVTYLAHQLKGAGGSYGYQKISADATQLETIAEATISRGIFDAENEMSRHAAALRAEVDRGIAELSSRS